MRRDSQIMRVGRRYELPDGERAALRASYERDGERLVDLAERYGVAAGTVSRWLRDEGATIRPRGVRLWRVFVSPPAGQRADM